MQLGIPVEAQRSERRVSVTPGVVTNLKKLGIDVLVEPGAGQKAGFSDEAYSEHGALLTANREELYSTADILSQIQLHDDAPYREGQIVVGLLNPLGSSEAMRKLAEAKVTSFALELLPRITRAQSMDALTSMATIAGYKAVLLAAEALDKLFPLMMTAAGTITPARVFIVGAGVAGLQAIATARRLGAVVWAYDVRPAVKEQVQSLGARFLELELPTEQAEGKGGYAQAMDEDFYRRQREAMTKALAESDVVITTAAVPGKKAPVLVTGEMVKGMRPGSVIVDLAAESGGNCEATRPGETDEVEGVTIFGPVQLPSTVPRDASGMYAHNIAAFLKILVKDGTVELNRDDQIIRETLVTHEGEVVNSRVREALGMNSETT